MKLALPLIATIALSAIVHGAAIQDQLPQPVTQSDFHGFVKLDFRLNNVPSCIVLPKQPRAGNPWIWRARFFGHEPQTDIAMLNAGFHLAYTEVGNLYGNPDAVARWNAFHAFLTEKLGFDSKPVLEGMSRGGLIIFNWAAENPDKVSAIYGDAPVCDIKSWPGGMGKGNGAPADFTNCLARYGLTKDNVTDFNGNPLDKAAALGNAGVPVLCVCGDVDQSVPYEENAKIFAERYNAVAANPLRIIIKPECAHHPHSLKDAAPIANFLKAHAIGENDFIKARGGIGNALCQFKNRKRATVAFIGGSITEMSTSYSRVMENEFRKLFPETDFRFINAGISSTCSDTGAFRLQQDVLSQADGKVDLLFVEFAVNDNQDGHLPPKQSRQAMEGIVRAARRHNPLIDIVFLYTANESHLDTYGKGTESILTKRPAYDNTRGPVVHPSEILAHEAVAEYYKLPSINFAADVQQRMQHGEFDWNTFGGVHPAPFGAAIYVDDIRCFVSHAKANDALQVRELPAPLETDCFQFGRIAPPSQARLDGKWTIAVPDWNAIGGATRPQYNAIPLLCATAPGATLRLDFSGSAIGVYSVAGPDAGRIRVTIDQRAPQEFDLFYSYSATLHYPRTQMFATDLDPNVPHSMTLELLPDSNPASKGTAARFVGFACN